MYIKINIWGSFLQENKSLCFFPTKLISSVFALNYVEQKRSFSGMFITTHIFCFCFLIEMKLFFIRWMNIREYNFWASWVFLANQAELEVRSLWSFESTISCVGINIFYYHFEWKWYLFNMLLCLLFLFKVVIA